VSVWIKPNSPTGYIVTHGQYSSSWDLILSNGRISFDIGYNNNNSSYASVGILGSYPINTTGNYWTHVVATYTCNNGNGTSQFGVCSSGTTGQMSLYINGVQDTGATINGQAQTAYTGGAPVLTGSLDTRIGARDGDLPQMSPSPFPFFSGSMDDVRVYSRALSPSDIKTLYGLGSVPAVSTDIYISQSGNGIGDGSSCSNAYSVAWLNSTYNNSVIAYSLSWDPVAMPGQIYPGVTVHLCGTISTGINIPGSGTGAFVLNAEGSGYYPGDMLSISQPGGGSGATVQVGLVSCAAGTETIYTTNLCTSGGAIAQFTITSTGSGYVNGASGIGLTSNEIQKYNGAAAGTGSGATFNSQPPASIIIKFDQATSAKMSAPVFTAAFSGNNVSYITIDGCYGSEDASGKCIPTGVLDAQGNDTSKAIIENTNNGSPYEYWQQYCSNNTLTSIQGYNYDINNHAICNYILNDVAIPADLDIAYPFQQTNSVAVSFSGGNNYTIKNLTMQNLYIRTPNSGDPAGGFGGFVTQDDVEYSCSSSTSCIETLQKASVFNPLSANYSGIPWNTPGYTFAYIQVTGVNCGSQCPGPGPITSYTVSPSGSGYAVGSSPTFNLGNGNDCSTSSLCGIGTTLSINSVTGAGAIATSAINNPGSGYNVGDSLVITNPAITANPANYGVVQRLVNSGWATQPIIPTLMSLSSLYYNYLYNNPQTIYNDSQTLNQHMTALFGSADNADQTIESILYNHVVRPGASNGVSVSGSNVLIQNNTMKLVQTGISAPMGTGQVNDTFDSNQILGYNHGIEMGGGAYSGGTVSSTTFAAAFPNPPNGQTSQVYGTNILNWLQQNNYVDSSGEVLTTLIALNSLTTPNALSTQFTDPAETTGGETEYQTILNILIQARSFPQPGLNRLIISNNYIDGYDVWGASTDIGFHQDPFIYYLSSPSSLIKNIDIFNNHIGPGFNPQQGGAGSAALFADLPSSMLENMRVYNNIFDLKSNSAGIPVIYGDGWGGAGGANALCANNTFIGAGGSFGGSGPNAYVYNNLDIDGGGVTMLDNFDGSTNPTYLNSEMSDYNLFYGLSRGNTNLFFLKSNQWAIDYPAWQQIHGLNGGYFDANSQFGQDPQLVQPNPNGAVIGGVLEPPDYHLQAWSYYAINHGKNLSSFCNGWPQPGQFDGDPGVPAPELCKDKDGNPRPQNESDSWDIGAYYFNGTRPQLGAPAAFPQSVYVTMGVASTITLTGVDPVSTTYPNGDPITYQIVTPQLNGTLTQSTTFPNQWTYTSTNSSVTSDSFIYTITDTVTGLVSNEALVSITIGNIKLSVSSPNSTYLTGQNITLNATASEIGANSVAISSVAFYESLVGSNPNTLPTLLGTVNGTGPYSMQWLPPSIGNYNVTVKATDINGQTAASQPLNIVVSTSLPNTTNGLVGYWNFNDGSGSTAKDCSSLVSGSSILTGNSNCNGSNSGSLYNGPTWSTLGPVSGDLTFNGLSQYVSTGISNIPGNDPLTVSAWVKLTTAPTGKEDIISLPGKVGLYPGVMDDSAPTILLDLEKEMGGNYTVRFYAHGGVSQNPVNYGAFFTVDSGVQLNPGQWYLIVGTIDSNNISIYVDPLNSTGTLVTTPTSGSSFVGLAAGPPSTMFIGAGENQGTVVNYFSGSIDDVRAYNLALQPQDVSQLFSMGQAVTYNLTVTNDGNGTITSAPSGINCGSTCASVPYNAGTVVTLTAMPASGYTTGWSANCAPVTGNPNACTITMTSAQTVTATFTSSSGTPVYGDVNGAVNGAVTIYDAELAAQSAVGLSVSPFYPANAEVDGTGAVDIYDAYLIAEYAAGLITKFPAQQ
jgi:hypothetical protein